MTSEGSSKRHRKSGKSRENQNSAQNGEHLDLGKLTLPTLKRYKRFHENYFSNLDSDHLKIRSELIKAVNKHFRSVEKSKRKNLIKF